MSRRAGCLLFGDDLDPDLHVRLHAPGRDSIRRGPHGVVTDFDEHGLASAYLFVDDADAVAASLKDAGIEVHWPEDTEWGKHEGAVLDPDEMSSGSVRP